MIANLVHLHYNIGFMLTFVSALALYVFNGNKKINSSTILVAAILASAWPFTYFCWIIVSAVMFLHYGYVLIRTCVHDRQRSELEWW